MTYPIRAVSKLTGIGIDTLRAWERRHGAVTPRRDDRGRLYSDAYVARLRLLHDAVSRGHAIGRAASLSDADLRRLLSRVPGTGARYRGQALGSGTGVRHHGQAAFDTRALMDAVARFDAGTVDAEIARFAATLAPGDLLRGVVMPILAGVGDAWHAERATIAHEHLMSATLRNVLGSLLRVYGSVRPRSARASLLLFATPSGERHELGSLGAAMLAATSGLEVVYLGPDLPAREIADSARAARAHAVVLGVTTTSRRKHSENELRVVARHLPGEVELWVGGRGAQRAAGALGARARILGDYDEFSLELARISAGV